MTDVENAKPSARTGRFNSKLCAPAAILIAMLSGTYAAAKTPWKELAAKSDEWYRGSQAALVGRSILSYQAAPGGWPKNIDTTARPYDGPREKLQGTFDNGATLGELRFLARIFNVTKEPQYENAFLKGLDHILAAQYPNGGWPQYFPPGKGYARHITFNDGATVGLLEFVREVAASDACAFVDKARRGQARASFDRGIQCILKCQVVVDGRRTAWCAQHDEIDYRPRGARSFELASLSGSESVGIVELLMSRERPSPEVVEAIEAAVAWFEAAKLTGIKVVDETDANSPTGLNKVVVSDPAAPPIWARFYEIGTNRPIYCDRDGVATANLSEISYERRNGYSWLGYRPQRLLSHDYPAWKQKWRP